MSSAYSSARPPSEQRDQHATPNDGSTTYHYRYDGNGNRCRTDTTACQGGSDPYQYNAANELTASPGVSSWSYDGNGNVSGNSAGASLTYNAKNQTTAMTYGGQTLVFAVVAVTACISGAIFANVLGRAYRSP